METDQLRGIRNSYYLGLFSDCCDDAKSLMSTNDFASFFYYRSLLHLSPATLLTNVTPSSPITHQVVKQLCIYLQSDSEGNDAEKEKSFTLVLEWSEDESFSRSLPLTIILAQMYFHQKDYKSALKFLTKQRESHVDMRDNMEILLQIVLIYLFIDRTDLALGTMKLLIEKDEDDVISQIGNLFITFHSPPVESKEKEAKLQETLNIILELQERGGAAQSFLLLNWTAIAEIHLGKYTQAFQNLRKARDIAIAAGAKQGGNGGKPAVETLRNSMVCLTHLRKGNEIIGKIEKEMKFHYPNHGYFKKQQDLDAEFEKAAKSYSWKKE